MVGFHSYRNPRSGAVNFVRVIITSKSKFNQPHVKHILRTNELPPLHLLLSIDNISTPKSMKAIVWEGKPFHMAVKHIPTPKIQHPNDALIRITTAAICGTDLHTYRGLAGSKNPPWIMGYEGIGVIVQTGSGVKSLKVGDRVTAGVVGCGYCDHCLWGRFTYCLTYDPSTLVDLPGLGDDSGVGLGGAQAQFIHVPFADSTCFKLPSGTDHEVDYVLLTDIFATAWYAVDCSGFQPGDSIAVFGAGPVGLLCAYSATLRGASKVYSIDYVQSRLDKAASIGAIPINFTHSDPVAQITAREPAGVRRSCDCVGFESLNDKLERQPGMVLDNCIRVTEATGGIGLIGEFPPPADGPTAGAPLSTGKEGLFPVSIGLLWVKGLSLNGGVAEVHRLQPLLRDLIESGKARPSFIVDEILFSLNVVPHSYERFEKREIGKPVIRLSCLDDDQIDNDGVAGGRILGKL